MTIFPRDYRRNRLSRPAISNHAPLPAYRRLAEYACMRGYQGVGGVGLDFWPVVKGYDGRLMALVVRRGHLSMPYTMTFLLAPGPRGPLPTARYQMLREGIQECEARLVVAKALEDDKTRAKLGEGLAERCARLIADRSNAIRAWYAKGVGVRVMMLGGEDTTVYVGKTPTYDPPERFAEPETGGGSLIARRKGKAATFVALHEPFKGGPGRHRVGKLEPIARDARGAAVRIAGKGIDGRAMVAIGDDYDKPRTVSGGGESFTLADYAHVRVGAGKVIVSGKLTAMKLRVKGPSKLTVNGKAVAAAVAGGMMSFGK